MPPSMVAGPPPPPVADGCSDCSTHDPFALLWASVFSFLGSVVVVEVVEVDVVVGKFDLVHVIWFSFIFGVMAGGGKSGSCVTGCCAIWKCASYK